MTDELDFLNMTQDQFLDALLRPQRRPSLDTQRLFIELQATKENGILSLSKKIIDIECDNIVDHFDSIPQELSEDFNCFADMVEKVVALPEECRQDKPEAAITRLHATPCFTKSRKGKPMIEPDGKGAYIWNDSFGPLDTSQSYTPQRVDGKKYIGTRWALFLRISTAMQQRARNGG